MTTNSQQSLKELSRKHIDRLWTPYIQMQTVRDQGPLVFDHAEGVYIYDVDGKQYLDGHASLWLMNVGFGRTEIADAAYAQMKELPLFSMFMGYSNRPAIALAEKLASLAEPEGMGKVFFSDGGSGAVETGLKMARAYWKNRGKSGKYKIIGRQRAYHGVTIAAVAASGLTANRSPAEPLVPGFRHIPAPDCYRNPWNTNDPDQVAMLASEALREMILFEGADTVAAFIAEPVQGAGGVIVPPESYLSRCREICTEHDVLFIADEVICGFGRTGTWFGSRTYGFKPDIMCFAKGLTSGYVPMGATMCSDEIYEAFLPPGDWFHHGSTYSGHATAAAAALVNLEIIERENLPENARVVGEHFVQGLRSLLRHPIVGDVRGVGLMARVELVADVSTKAPFDPPGSMAARLQKRCQELGLIFRPTLDVITFSPPLILTKTQADWIVEVLDQAITEVVSS